MRVYEHGAGRSHKLPSTMLLVITWNGKFFLSYFRKKRKVSRRYANEQNLKLRLIKLRLLTFLLKKKENKKRNKKETENRFNFPKLKSKYLANKPRSTELRIRGAECEPGVFLFPSAKFIDSTHEQLK